MIIYIGNIYVMIAFHTKAWFNKLYEYETANALKILMDDKLEVVSYITMYLIRKAWRY
jgi:hypothetical protein